MNRKAISLTIALVLALSLFGAALPAGVQADSDSTYYVATTGNDSTGNGTSGNPWQTIQYAVDTVPPGSTKT